MTQVEQWLAKLLRSAAPRSPRVAFEEVAGRAHRRRAIRWSLAASLGVVALVLIAASVVAGAGDPPARLTTRSSVDLTNTIPWIDTPARPFQALTASPTPPPATDARPCTAADVTARFADGNGGGGHLVNSIALRNISRSTCVLKGYPRVSATEPGQLDFNGTDGSYFPAIYGTANMPPGHDTLLGVETDTQCSAHPGGLGLSPGGPRYRHLRIALPGGGTVRLDWASAGFDVRCGLHLTQFYVGQPERPAPHDPLDDLTVSLDVPPSVSAGATLRYVANLTNPTDKAISFSRCPSYVEAGTGPARVKERYALNCAFSAVARHATVRFEMRLRMPAAQPPGAFAFLWTLGPDVTDSATVTVTAPTAGPARATHS